MISTTAGDPLLQPSENRLFRQVRVRDFKNGIVTSLAFRPMPEKDHGELSVDVEYLTIGQQALHTTPQQSYEAFKANGGETTGVYAVTTQECSNHGLSAYHKPRTTPPPNLAHGYIDFKPLTANEQRRKGARLAELAMARGCVHPAGQAPPASMSPPAPSAG